MGGIYADTRSCLLLACAESFIGFNNEPLNGKPPV